MDDLQHSDILYRPTDIKDCSAIDLLVSSTTAAGIKPRGTSYYQSIIFNNPHGKTISYIALDGNKVVGHFCAAPKLFKIKECIFTAYKTMEMFTDSAYQGLGIGSKLVKLVLDEVNTTGPEFIYTTPSDYSAPLFLNKFGFEEPFSFKEYWSIIDHFSAAKQRIATIVPQYSFSCPSHRPDLPLRPVAPLKVIKMEEFSRLAIDFAKRGSNLVCQNIDEDYIHWRYSTSQEYIFMKLDIGSPDQAVVALRIMCLGKVKVGIIVDIFAASTTSCTEIVKHVKTYFKSNKCLLALAWCSGFEMSDIALGSNGFRERRYGLWPLKKTTRRFLLKYCCTHETKKILEVQSNWSFSIGAGNDY